MKVLVINAILYTAETKDIPKIESVKDTMIYDLCLAFKESGHDITLYAAEPYRPVTTENYPFEIVWGKCKLSSIFLPNRLPWMPDIKNYLKNNEFDLIISSEVFSISTYYAYRRYPEQTIAWHEIAKHQAMMHKIPSKFWYNVVVKYLMKDLHVVARSKEAKEFIKQYCRNTEGVIIDHGVNLDKFKVEENKEDYFVVCSQLIKRKCIDGIIENFDEFIKTGHENYRLYIIGDGDERENLEKQSKELGLTKYIVFAGKLSHVELLPILSKARGLLVNTKKDNNMVSIVEAIAVGTPVITTDIPLNASYIKKYGLGIVDNKWDKDALVKLGNNGEKYINNCIKYRAQLSARKKVDDFLKIAEYD